MIDAVKGGAAGSKSLEIYSDRILKRDFAPGFFIDHFIKDMDMALKECERLNLKLPGLELVREMYGKV